MLLTLPCLAIVFQPGPEFKHGSRQGIRPCFRAPMPGEAAPSPDEILSDKSLYPGQSFRPLEAGRLRIDSGGRCQPRLQPFERRHLWVNTHGSIQRFRCPSTDITSENSRKQENSSFSFHFLTLRLMKTRVCWSKKEASPHENNVFALEKIGDISPKTGKQKSKPTYSWAKSEKSPRFMHKKTRNHPLTLSFFRPTALPHAHPPTEFSKHDYFSDDVNLHQLPQRGNLFGHSRTFDVTICKSAQLPASIDAGFPLEAQHRLVSPLPALILALPTPPTLCFKPHAYPDGYLLVRYVRFRWL